MGRSDMGRSDIRYVPTQVGRLAVQVRGDGPAVLLWHSMLVDSEQWSRMLDQLTATRTVVLLDGPGHGRSGEPPATFSLRDCADAAVTVLDECGIEIVDWVGNAWGGHVGLIFAARHPDRCRSVTAIATPTVALPAVERMQTRGLAVGYRLLGPNALLGNAIADTLLGKRSRRSDVAGRTIVRDGFARAGRSGMRRAIRAMMLHRPDIGAVLPQITVPALFVAGRSDAMWPPEVSARYAATIPGGTSVVVEDAHRLPALEQPVAVLAELGKFWGRVNEQAATTQTAVKENTP